MFHPLRDCDLCRSYVMRHLILYTVFIIVGLIRAFIHIGSLTNEFQSSFTEPCIHILLMFHTFRDCDLCRSYMMRHFVYGIHHCWLNPSFYSYWFTDKLISKQFSSYSFITHSHSAKTHLKRLLILQTRVVIYTHGLISLFSFLGLLSTQAKFPCPF